MKDVNIGIIGAGIVATTLAAVLSENQISVNAVGARNTDSAKQAFAAIGLEEKVTTMENAARSADIIFLLVSDDALALVIDYLIKNASIKNGACVIHCSGAMASDILRPSNGNYYVASAHPLQTFSSIQSAKRSLKQSTWFCEGDSEALRLIKPIVETISAKYIELQSSHKSLYHAGAVLSCNYLAALIEAALQCNALAGIDRVDAINALRPLIDATLDNIQERGPAEALTGPIARGDSSTVEIHLNSLQKHPTLTSLYKELGRHTLELSKEKAQAPIDKLTQIEKLLLQ